MTANIISSTTLRKTCDPSDTYQFSSSCAVSQGCQWSGRGRQACQSSLCAGRPSRPPGGYPAGGQPRRGSPSSPCRPVPSQPPGQSADSNTSRYKHTFQRQASRNTAIHYARDSKIDWTSEKKSAGLPFITTFRGSLGPPHHAHRGSFWYYKGSHCFPWNLHMCTSHFPLQYYKQSF